MLASGKHTGGQRTLCIVDPTLTGEGGHSLAYDLLLARMATSFDHVAIFADRGFHLKEYDHVHAKLGLLHLDVLKAYASSAFKKIRPVQVFQPVLLDFRFTEEDLWEPVKLSSYIGKRLRALDLSWFLYWLLRVRYSQVQDMHIVFQNAGMEELFCLETMRNFLSAGLRTVTVHLVFRHSPERTCSRVVTMQHFAELIQRQSTLGNVRMYTDTEELSIAFKSIGTAPSQFQVLPVPLLIEKKDVPRCNNWTFRLGMLGPPRMEKGFGCVPSLLAALPKSVGGKVLELVVQIDAAAATLENRVVTAILEKHAKMAVEDPSALKLQLLLGPLDVETYARCFAEIDCMLILYSSPKYAVSSSGVFVEALHFGIPSIVFAGTWMGRLVKEAALEGLSIGLCVESLREVPTALARIESEYLLFSDGIAKYLASHAWRFDPHLLISKMFGSPTPFSDSKDEAEPC